MRKSGKDRKNLPAIAPDTKVADILKAYPEAIDALVEMGFEPLKNPIARRTVAKLFSLEQAANFRGVAVEDMLNVIRKAAGVEVTETQSSSPKEAEELKDGPVPELKGDIRYLGLVPCPIRNVLIDKFDAFVRKLTASTGTSIAWWMAGEGTGTKDVRAWLQKIIKENDFDKIPDIFTAVGTEIFLHKEYGRKLIDKGIFKSIPNINNPRKEFENLIDPTGRLALQFAALFTFSCRKDLLPDGLMPETWTDLAKPEYEGYVAFPSHDLPIMPDLLGALYHYLGEEKYEMLASNIAKTMHPAQGSPRAGKKDVPGIVIMPVHFTKMAESTGAVQVIPEDGPVAVPAYMAVRENAGKEADDILEYLRSAEFLELMWKFGSFVPNNADIPIDMKFNNVITRPWDAVLNGDPDEETKKLISTIMTGVLT